MKYLELLKENILYSEYSNINDLKELDIFKNYKNLKEMLSYFILVYSIYTNGISIVVVAVIILCEEWNKKILYGFCSTLFLLKYIIKNFLK